MPSATRPFVRSVLITVTVAVMLMFAVPGALAGGSPSTLVFAVQPTTTQVQTEMSPAVVVDVEDSMGHLITSFNGPVTLNYAPGTNVLNAPPPTGNTVYAVNGVATFSDLTFSAAGFGFDLLSGGHTVVHVAAGDHHVGAAVGGGERHLASQSAAAAGDQDDPVRQVEKLIRITHFSGPPSATSVPARQPW